MEPPRVAKFQAPRGTRDLYPPQMALRNWIADCWRRVSVRNGFVEYDGPTFEQLDLYRVKSGEEIVSQLFDFEDRGGRRFAIRPEMTPTLARMVAARANSLPRPIKWFSIPRMCRAEKPQRGRLREFYQWNADILGVDDVLADAEIIAVAVAFLREVGLTHEDVVVKLSSRPIATAALASIGIEASQAGRATNGLWAHVGGPYNALMRGNEAQRKKYLEPAMRGEWTVAYAVTEPNAGSDLASLQSRAVRDGDDWIISGQKTFISGHGDPDYLFGPIVTDTDAPRHRNLGYFLIPCPSPGLELTRLNLLTGHDQSFIFMDNVRVPGDCLIGGELEGWQVTQTTLEIEHGGRGVALPIDEALENLLKYTKEIQRNGEPVGNDPVLQQLAADAYIDSRINTLFAQRNYWMYQARQEMTYHGSQSDLFRKTFRIRNADRARDIMNMYSLLGVDDPRAPFGGQPEVYQRSSLTGAHPGGTLEVQKLIISRRLGISRTRERAAATPSTTGVQGV